MSLKFIKTLDDDNGFDLHTVEITTDAVYLPEILEVMEYFLRASGFVVNGSLQIINETESNNED